jgi:hypothetical protein
MGGGDRPAITMTHYAAETSVNGCLKKPERNIGCRLKRNGKMQQEEVRKRLISLKEIPKTFTDQGFWRKSSVPNEGIAPTLFSVRTVRIEHKTVRVKANPFGLKNMLGNVMDIVRQI